MATRKRTRPDSKYPNLAQCCIALHKLAPLGLAQSWDNLGLLAGDATATVKKALLCIDLMPAVADEAIHGKYDLVVAYHPPILKPIARLTAQSPGPEATVFRCIRAGIAIYSTHTALDAADGGTSDVLAELCGINQAEPIEYIDAPGSDNVKIVVFVPRENLDAVAEAMFTAGAGRIGDYRKCSYRLEGVGTFHGSESTNPAVGKSGRLEAVPEVRLETVCPKRRLPQTVAALVAAHPYEEPAFDIYPVQPKPIRGTGRVGNLPRPVTLAALARKLKRAAQANCVQIVGDGKQSVSRAIILAGAAGSLPISVIPLPGDVIITGEIRHHDALAIQRSGRCAIALNHWTSERPALASFAERLAEEIPVLEVRLSDADGEPFRPV